MYRPIYVMLCLTAVEGRIGAQRRSQVSLVGGGLTEFQGGGG